LEYLQEFTYICRLEDKTATNNLKSIREEKDIILSN